MGSLDQSNLPDGALVLVDTAPIIYVLERDPKFERQDAGAIQFAVTTITIAEVTTGPLKAGEEALAKR